MHVILPDSFVSNLSLARLEKSNYTVPPDHRDGGLPLISDSLFSLIIMLYVLIAFVFVFFLFCWRRGPDQPLLETKVRLGRAAGGGGFLPFKMAGIEEIGKLQEVNNSIFSVL